MKAPIRKVSVGPHMGIFAVNAPAALALVALWLRRKHRRRLMLMNTRKVVLMNKEVMEQVRKLLQNPQVTIYVSREVYEKIKLIFPGRVKPIY